MDDDKICILDPLTTLCKLALLYFLPENTKLSINNYVLHIQEYNYLQGAKRMINRDKRTDISNLNTPILKAIKWYILENDKKVIFAEEKTNQSIRIIATYAIKGLKKAQEITYGTDMSVRIILQYFINILTAAIDSDWSETQIVQNQSVDSILTDKIKNNYDLQLINYTSQVLQEAEKSSPTDVTIMIECVHKLFRNRDTQFVLIMKELNTVL